MNDGGEKAQILDHHMKQIEKIQSKLNETLTALDKRMNATTQGQ